MRKLRGTGPTIVISHHTNGQPKGRRYTDRVSGNRIMKHPQEFGIEMFQGD